MLRFKVIKWLYPLLKRLTNLYFIFVNLAFNIGNYFSRKYIVQPVHNDLLLISATKAAEKIRQRTAFNSLSFVNPLINAVIQDNFAAALDEAKSVDDYLDGLNTDSEEYSELVIKKPLLGIPFTCKDNLRVKDFVTVAGLPRFTGNPKNERDAECVQRLRDSGAILIGLTNLPTLAMGWNCDNPVYGRTNNPYDSRRMPGGSSGGEGAIIAAAGSLFGPGNDLAGSIRHPASTCGVFGLRPTPGLVSLDGIVPEITGQYTKEQWSIGPLCRFAEDLRVVLETMIGCEVLEKHKLRLHDPVDFRKIRVFYMDELKIVLCENLNPDIRNAIRRAAKYFETKFELMAQHVHFPLANHFYEIWGALGFDARTYTFCELFIEYWKFLKGESEMSFAAIAYALLHKFLKPYNEEERDFLLSKRQKLRKGIEMLLGADGILISPAIINPAPFHHQYYFTHFNKPAQLCNVLGLPAISCPLGLNKDGLPVGVQIIGAPYSEGLLIAAAKELEKGFGGWAPLAK